MKTQKLLLALLIFFITQVAFSTINTENNKQYWQLIFSYSENEITLISADKIPEMRKKIQSPGLLGSAINLPYSLDWLNASGIILKQTNIEIPLGTRIPPNADMSGNDKFIPKEGSFVLRIEGPKNLQPESLLLKPVELSKRTEKELEIIPLIFKKNVMKININKIIKSKAEGVVSVTKIQDTGSDDNRVVFVIMGDGYTSADLTSGAFSNAVANYISYHTSEPPWDTLNPAVNIYRIDVESNESGADYEDASPNSGGTEKDTYFDSSFWYDNVTERLLYTKKSSLVYSVANDNLGIGNWDQILVFVNSTKYGGGGGSFAVASVHSSSKMVMIHEMGHSFAGLADEYFYSDGTYTGSNPSKPNVDISSNNPKWKVWLEPTTPLPTPDSATYNTTVGTFEGAYYKKYGIYRPWRNCCMRALGNDLCPVCKEAHLLEFFDMVSLDDILTPDNSSSVTIDTPQIFSITSIPISGFSFQWYLSGIPLANETNETVTISKSQLAMPTETLSATILYDTELIRATTVSQTYNWTVNAIPEPGTISAICLVFIMFFQLRKMF